MFQSGACDSCVCVCERGCACALLVYLLHICICICICFLSRSSVNACMSLRAWAFEWVCVQAHAVAREIALLKRAFSSSVQKSNSRIRLRVVSSLSRAALPDKSPGSFIRFATLSTCRTPSRPAHRQSPPRQSMNHTPLWACVHAPSAFMCCLAGAGPQTGMATQGETKPTCELHVGHEVWQSDATQRGGPDFKRGELRAPGTRSGARTARKPRGARLRSTESQWQDQRGTGCRPERHPLHRIHTCTRSGSSRIRPMLTLGVVRARAGRPERHWAPYTGTHLVLRCHASTPAILRSWGYCWRSGAEASSPAFRLRRLASGRAELSLSESSHKTSFQTGK